MQFKEIIFGIGLILNKHVETTCCASAENLKFLKPMHILKDSYMYIATN